MTFRGYWNPGTPVPTFEKYWKRHCCHQKKTRPLYWAMSNSKLYQCGMFKVAVFFDLDLHNKYMLFDYDQGTEHSDLKCCMTSTPRLYCIVLQRVQNCTIPSNLNIKLRLLVCSIQIFVTLCWGQNLTLFCVSTTPFVRIWHLLKLKRQMTFGFKRRRRIRMSNINR